MTKKEFDNFSFTVKTKIKVKGQWYEIAGVDFWRKEVLAQGGSILIKDIEESRN